MTTIPNLVIYIVYIILVALVNALMTSKYGREWARHEWARWAMGIGNVLLLSLCVLLLVDGDALEAWAVVASGFVVAGGVKGYRHIIDENNSHNEQMNEARQAIDRELGE